METILYSFPLEDPPHAISPAQDRKISLRSRNSILPVSIILIIKKPGIIIMKSGFQKPSMMKMHYTKNVLKYKIKNFYIIAALDPVR